MGLSIALMGNCRLLLLDEPFNGLDQKISKELVETLQSLKIEKKISMIISTHEIHHLKPIADSLLFMENKKTLSKKVGNEQSLQSAYDELMGISA